MLAVLSPSKTLNMEQTAPVGTPREPALIEETKELVSVMQTKSEADLKALMGISDNLAELNHARYQSFTFPFNEINSKQALFAFRGDVYDGLDADNLREAEQRAANDHVRILSGLYGVLRPLDWMQPYRLEMGIKLATEHGDNLYQFWGDKITGQLNDALEATGAEALVNLASNEYFKALKPKQLKKPLITVHFKEEKDGKFRTIALFAKKARGMMARHMIQTNAKTVDDLRGFTMADYRYNPALFDDTQLTFTRNQP